MEQYVALTNHLQDRDDTAEWEGKKIELKEDGRAFQRVSG